MTIKWQRTHWIVFLVLLVCQAFGVWALVQRSGLHDGTLRVPFFFVPVWIIGSAFLTTVIVVEVVSAVWKSTRAKGILVMIAAILLSWMIFILTRYK